MPGCDRNVELPLEKYVQQFHSEGGIGPAYSGMSVVHLLVCVSLNKPLASLPHSG